MPPLITVPSTVSRNMIMAFHCWIQMFYLHQDSQRAEYQERVYPQRSFGGGPNSSQHCSQSLLSCQLSQLLRIFAGTAFRGLACPQAWLSTAWLLCSLQSLERLYLLRLLQLWARRSGFGCSKRECGQCAEESCGIWRSQMKLREELGGVCCCCDIFEGGQLAAPAVSWTSWHCLLAGLLTQPRLLLFYPCSSAPLPSS